MDAAVVEEVISDLDISGTPRRRSADRPSSDPEPRKFTRARWPRLFPRPLTADPLTERTANNGSHLSPSEARAYMEQIVMQLQKSSQLVTEALSIAARRPSRQIGLREWRTGKSFSFPGMHNNVHNNNKANIFPLFLQLSTALFKEFPVGNVRRQFLLNSMKLFDLVLMVASFWTGRGNSF